MQTLIKALAALILLTSASIVGYISITPRVLLVNGASQSFDEFIVKLPGSRISFGPIDPDSSQKIYFSTQSSGGFLEYSLLSGGKELASGILPYDANGQYCRSVIFTIHGNGTIWGKVSG